MLQKITVLIKVFGFIKCPLKQSHAFYNKMSSEQQITSKSFTYVLLPFFWMMILHPYTWYLTELLVLMIFLTDLVLSYSDKYLFVYVRIFSGVLYFLSDFLLEIVHLLVGILFNPLLPNKTNAHESMFFLYLFQFADKCFRSNHRAWNSLISRRFTWKFEIYWSKCWNDIIIYNLQVQYEWQINTYSMFWQ